MAKMPPMSRNGSDDFQTPPEALEPLLPHLRPGWTIWEPACGKRNLVKPLRQAGHDVIDTDKKEGKDFLTWQPTVWDAIVTNPPFSLKNKFLDRAYALGKPFAFLLPLTALESATRQCLFRQNDIQLILMEKRIHFETPNQNVSHSWFASAWFCWGLSLPRQLTFGNQSEPMSQVRKTKIKDIIITNLARKDLGDLDGLADSIKRFGLLHPIGVTTTNELVYGRRRLEAHKLLGLEDIEVRIMYDRN